MSADQPLTGDELATIKTRADSWAAGVTGYYPERFEPEEVLRLVAEVERLQARVERVEKFQKGLVVLGGLPIEKRPDGLTGGIEACAALADDIRAVLDGP